MKNEFGRQYVVIPYETLVKATDAMEELGESESSFSKMLDAYQQYMAADLTPVVLYDIFNNEMYCIVRELYGKKLH